MSVDALRWLVFMLNLCLAVLVGLCGYIFYFVEPPRGEAVPKIDVASLNRIIQAQPARTQDEDPARWMVIVNTMEPPEAPTPPVPGPEAGGPAAAGPASTAPKPEAGSLQAYVNAHYDVDLVIWDPETNLSSALLKLKRQGNRVEWFGLGLPLESDKPVSIKRVERREDRDGQPYFEVVFQDDQGGEATLEYRSAPE